MMPQGRPAQGNVTKVTWTAGQHGSMLSLGGKAVLGEGCLASCEPFAGRLLFGTKSPICLNAVESGFLPDSSNICRMVSSLVGAFVCKRF